MKSNIKHYLIIYLFALVSSLIPFELEADDFTVLFNHNSITAGTNFFEFNLGLNINPTCYASQIEISNPFTISQNNFPMFVYQILIGSNSKAILQSENTPLDSTYVTWFYHEEEQKLIVKLFDNTFTSFISVNYIQDIPCYVSESEELYINIIDNGTILRPQNYEIPIVISPSSYQTLLIESFYSTNYRETEVIYLTSGDVTNLFAIKRDEWGNYIGKNDNCIWSIEPHIGTFISFEGGVEFEGSSFGYGEISLVDDNDLTLSDTCPVFIETNIPSQLNIFDSFNNQILDTTNLLCSDSLAVYVEVTDTYGNQITDADISWNIDLIGDYLSFENGYSNVFHPVTETTYTLTVSATASETTIDNNLTISTSTGIPNILALENENFNLTNNTYNITVDDTFTFDFVIRDDDGNPHNYEEITVEPHFSSTIPPILSVVDNTVSLSIDANASGIGTGYIEIVKTYQGIQYELNTPTIVFEEGIPTTITFYDTSSNPITEVSDLLCSDSLAVYVEVIDAYGNQINNANVSWNIDLTGDYLSMGNGYSTVFHPATETTYTLTVSATASETTIDSTLIINTITGLPNALELENENFNLTNNTYNITVDDTFTFDFVIRDDDGNPHNYEEITVEPHFSSTIPPILSVVDNTVSLSIDANASGIGTGYIEIVKTYQGIQYELNTPTIVFEEGIPTTITFYDTSSNPITEVSDLLCSDSLAVYVEVIDAYGNQINNANVSWNIDLTGDYLSMGNGYSTVFHPATETTYTLTVSATASETTIDNNLTISTSTGIPNILALENENFNLTNNTYNITVDDTFTFDFVIRDDDGNPHNYEEITVEPHFSSTIPPILSVVDNTVSLSIDANASGIGTGYIEIVKTYQGIQYELNTPTIVFEEGIPTTITFYDTSSNPITEVSDLLCSDSLAVYVEVIDAYGNQINNANVSWNIDLTGDYLSMGNGYSNVFHPVTETTYTLTVSATASETTIDSTLIINTITGLPNALELENENFNLTNNTYNITVDDTFTFDFVIRDDDGNPHNYEEITVEPHFSSTIPPILSVVDNTVSLSIDANASGIGTGYIEIVKTYQGIQYELNTPTIVFEEGIPTTITFYDTSSNPITEVSDLLCSDSLAVYVEVIDAYGNQINNANVSWNIDLTGDYLSMGNGYSTVFHPATETTYTLTVSATASETTIDNNLTISTSTGIPNILALENENFNLTNNTYNITVDDTFTFDFVIRDDDGNPHNYEEITVEPHFSSTIPPILSVVDNTVSLSIDANASGIGTGYIEIVKTYQGIQYELNTPTIVFEEGIPTTITFYDTSSNPITEVSDLLCSDSLAVYVEVIDAYGNQINNANVSWNIDLTGDYLSMGNGYSTVLHPATETTYTLTVSATASETTIDSTLIINTITGLPNALELENENFNLTNNTYNITVDDTFTFDFVIRDDDGNPHNYEEITVEPHFSSTIPPILSVVDNTVSLSIDANASGIGTGYIEIVKTYQGIQYELNTPTIVLDVGTPRFLYIKDAPFPIEGNDISLSDVTVGSSVDMYAICEDQHYNNIELEPNALNWIISPLELENSIEVNGIFATFRPTTASSEVTITVSYVDFEIKHSIGPFSIFDRPNLSYVDSTLTPLIISPGEEICFSLNIRNQNRACTSIELSTQSYLSLFDSQTGSECISHLEQEVSINDSSISLLEFEKLEIPNDFTAETYPIELHLDGTFSCLNSDELGEYSETIIIENNQVCISNVVIETVSSVNSVVYPGDKDTVFVQFSNFGTLDVSVTEVQLTFNGTANNDHNYDTVIESFSLPPNSSRTEEFEVTVNNNASLGNVVLDANFTAINQIGNPYHVSDALSTDSWDIVTPPNIEYCQSSLHVNGTSFDGELHVTQGQNTEFSFNLQNTGSVGVKLIRDSTYIEYIHIDGTVVKSLMTQDSLLVNPNDSSAIEFCSIESYFPNLGLDTLHFTCMGIDNNAYKYSTSFYIPDLLTVVDSFSPIVEQNNIEIVKTYPVNPEIQLSNIGGVLGILSESNTSLTISAVNYEEELGKPISIGIDSEVMLIFEEFTFPADTSPQVDFVLNIEGVDSNNASFAHQLPGTCNLKNPVSFQLLSYSPHQAVLNDQASFSVTVKNNGGVYFDPTGQTKISFIKDSINLFTSLAEIETRVLSGETSEITFFSEEIVADIDPGMGVFEVEIIGVDSHNNPVYETVSLQVDIENRGYPQIESVWFIDGGLNETPNGIVDSTDALKVCFDDKPIISNGIRESYSFFQLIGRNDSFGEINTSKIVTSEEMYYTGIDKDSTLFVQLAQDCKISLPYQDNHFDAEITPSYLIIKPDIERDLLCDVNKGDAGFECNRTLLSDQLNEISQHIPGINICSHEVRIQDNIPPLLLNPYPIGNAMNDNYYSKYSDVSIMASGRNYVDSNVLRQELIQYFTDLEVDSMISNYDTLYVKLQSLTDDDINFIANKFKNHIPSSIDLNLDNLIVNPFAQMYSGLKEEFISVELTNEFSNYNNLTTNYNEIEDKIYNNLTVKSQNTFDGEITAKLQVSDHYNQTYSDTTFQFIVSKPGRDYITYGNQEYLLRTAPNPINLNRDKEIYLEYILPNIADHIAIIIVDSGGNIVKKISYTNAMDTNTGKHLKQNFWNLRNGRGDRISKGIYLILLEVDGDVKAGWHIVGDK